MPVIDPDEFELVERPELIVGLVAAVGTPLEYVRRTLEQILNERDYQVTPISLSEQLAGITLNTPPPPDDASQYEQLMAKMDRGNELRRIAGGGEALALLAAARINEQRPDVGPGGEPPHLSGRAFVLRQLKHPDEVLWLRRIYGNAFHLVGVYCPESVRRENLILHGGMDEDEANTLIRRDEAEEHSYGQQLRDTYYRSDVFVRLDGHDEVAARVTKDQLERYFKLLFGELDQGIIAPSVDEYGMHLAFAAALRSSDLARQVGAAILSDRRDVLALGTNEVPAAGGGQYWSDRPGGRDCDRGEDSNTTMKERILREILELSDEQFAELDPEAKKAQVASVAERLENARVMNLTEFGRAVHAEMDALLGAGRNGVSTREATVYTTTYPCHNCAKHIVAAGVDRVVYIEPYPKSLAEELHSDSISLSRGTEDEKVCFDSFVGVAPRKFEALFSTTGTDGKRLRRKNPNGTVRRDELGLRMKAEAPIYIDREAAAALAVAQIGQLGMREGENHEEEGREQSKDDPS